MKEVNKAIEKQAKGFISSLLSIKGIGPVYAAGILASIGDVSRFSSHNKLARFAGLVWKRKQTGNSESENTRLVRECDKYLKNTIWWKQQTHCGCTMRPSRCSTQEKISGGEKTPA